MRYFLLTLAGLAANILFSQETNVLMGIVPELSLNYKLNDKFKLNAIAEFYNDGFSKTGSEPFTWDYGYDRTDLQLFGSYRINPLQSVALGYQYSIRNAASDAHKITQQITLLRRPDKILFGHRFRADQTFYAHNGPRFRIRYRLSLELPLQGSSIDPGEFYMVPSDEVLIGLQENKASFENRLSVHLGYLLQNDNKLQLGLDYRTGFKESSIYHSLWMRVAFFFNLKS